MMTSADLSNFAYGHGYFEPEQAWLLHDFDVWVKNPYYDGPPVRHPEDDSDDRGPQVPWLTVPVSMAECPLLDEIPW